MSILDEVRKMGKKAPKNRAQRRAEEKRARNQPFQEVKQGVQAQIDQEKAMRRRRQVEKIEKRRKRKELLAKKKLAEKEGLFATHIKK